jgi:hypothetical protein
MKRSLPITLILLGSFLEIYYYTWKYTSEGESIWLSVIKGAALTILTIGLALLLRKHWGFYILISLSIAYSIFCTSSGQATAYAGRYNSQQAVITTQQTDYERAEEERATLLSDIQSLKEQKREKEQARDDIPISSRTYWQFVGFDSEGDARYQKAESEVFKTLNEEIQSYEQQIQEAQKRLDNLEVPQVVIQEKETDSYAILHDMTGLSEVTWQYILQSMFSLFAAVMAPIGISMFSIPEKKEKKKSIDIEPFVRFWVKWSWYGYRNGKGPALLPQDVFMKHAEKKMPGFTPEIYDRIKKAAFISNVIDTNWQACYNEEEKVIQKILEVCDDDGSSPRLRGKKRRGRKS